MALIGGGGAGNVTGGSNPSGSGTGLNYIGDHAYAYSGEVNTPSDGSALAILDFTTGSQYIVCKILFGVNHDTNDNLGFQVKLNGLLSAGFAITGGVGDAQSSNYIPFLIPSHSHIECTIQNYSSTATIPVHVSIVGVVYG